MADPVIAHAELIEHTGQDGHDGIARLISFQISHGDNSEASGLNDGNSVHAERKRGNVTQQHERCGEAAARSHSTPHRRHDSERQRTGKKERGRSGASDEDECTRGRLSGKGTTQADDDRGAEQSTRSGGQQLRGELGWLRRRRAACDRPRLLTKVRQPAALQPLIHTAEPASTVVALAAHHVLRRVAGV